MNQLEKDYQKLDLLLEQKIKELAAKIRPAIIEFLNDTAIPIISINPNYIEVTRVGDETPRYTLGEIMIRTRRK